MRRNLRSSEKKLIELMYSALEEYGLISHSKNENGFTWKNLETYYWRNIPWDHTEERWRYDVMFGNLHKRNEMRNRDTEFFRTRSISRKETVYYYEYILWDRKFHREIRSPFSEKVGAFLTDNESEKVLEKFGYELRKKIYFVSRKPGGFPGLSIVDHWFDEDRKFYFVVAGSPEHDGKRTASLIFQCPAIDFKGDKRK